MPEVSIQKSQRHKRPTFVWLPGPLVKSRYARYRALKYKYSDATLCALGIVQELCESRGGRPGLSVLTSLLASVDVKI